MRLTAKGRSVARSVWLLWMLLGRVGGVVAAAALTKVGLEAGGVGRMRPEWSSEAG